MSSPNLVDGGPVDPAPKPIRRTFTAQYRDRILDEYLAAPHGEKGAVLRREGLYQSQMREWAQARESGSSALNVDGRVCDTAGWCGGWAHGPPVGSKAPHDRPSELTRARYNPT